MDKKKIKREYLKNDTLNKFLIFQNLLNLYFIIKIILRLFTF